MCNNNTFEFKKMNTFNTQRVYSLIIAISKSQRCKKKVSYEKKRERDERERESDRVSALKAESFWSLFDHNDRGGASRDGDITRNLARIRI